MGHQVPKFVPNSMAPIHYPTLHSLICNVYHVTPPLAHMFSLHGFGLPVEKDLFGLMKGLLGINV